MIIAIHLTNLIIRSLQPKVLQSNRMIMDLDTKGSKLYFGIEFRTFHF